MPLINDYFKLVNDNDICVSADGMYQPVARIENVALAKTLLRFSQFAIDVSQILEDPNVDEEIMEKLAKIFSEAQADISKLICPAGEPPCPRECGKELRYAKMTNCSYSDYYYCPKCEYVFDTEDIRVIGRLE